MRPLSIRTAQNGLIALSATASVFCLLLAVWLSLTSTTDATARATQTLVVQADTIARQIDTDVALFDLALRDAARPPPPREPAARAPLLDLPLTSHYIGFINVLNEAGDVVADRRSNVSRPANFAGRDYFQDHLKNPADILMIGRPFATAPNQHASIPLSRRLTTPEGAFAGVVVAGVRLAWLNDLMSHWPPGPTVTIRREDGVILTRAPFDAEAIGRNGAADPAWRDYLRTGGSPAADDAQGLRLFRRVGALPLVLELALDREEIAAGEPSWLIWLPILGLVPGVCVLGLSLIIRRLHRRRLQTEAAADAANEDRMRLLATMSHELRTPLTGILGQVELLTEESELNDRQMSRLHKLTEAGALMRAVVNRVTDVARPETRDGPPVLAPSDLDELVGACVGMVEGEARKKGLRLTTFVDPSTPARPRLARDLVQQVLLNLLMNAVKYTAQGMVAMRVTGTATGLRFEIADTGSGIPAGKRRRLFREYDRLDTPVSRAEGTGLGLSITEGFVRRMGGRIGHDDNPGGGSVFWVELPTPEPAIPETILRAPPVEPAPVQHVASLRILLADDLDLTRSVTADYLRSAGHAVTEVADGTAAVDAVRTRDFDVVLTDMRMPVMDGLEATSRIRALPGHRGHTPVVLLTADLVALGLGASARSGVDLCVMKPFTRAELLAAVHTAAHLTSPPYGNSPDTSAFDETVFAELRHRLGDSLFESHLHTAAQRIDDLIGLLDLPDAAENPIVEAAVHDLAGISGLLGLTAYSACLRDFEMARDRLATVTALRQAAVEAVSALRRQQTLAGEWSSPGYAPDLLQDSAVADATMRNKEDL